jgi:hypothetical protein
VTDVEHAAPAANQQTAADSESDLVVAHPCTHKLAPRDLTASSPRELGDQPVGIAAKNGDFLPPGGSFST